MSDNNTGNTINFPTNNSSSELDPITGLPKVNHVQNFSIPSGDWSMMDIINEQTDEGFHSNRYNRPTVVPGNIYDNEDVDWDVRNIGNIDRRLAKDQSGWSQFSAWLNQSVLGEIVGGTMEGFGSLLDAIDGDLMNDYTNDSSSWFDSLAAGLNVTGRDLREWTQEVTPIYSIPTAKKWNPSDSGWWASNGVSVVSTLSLMIPGLAVTRGASMAGRGLRSLNAVTKGMKSAKVNSAIANALTLSRTGKWLTKSTIMGLSMRHMENYREAAQTFDESYDKTYEFFKDQSKLDAFIDSPEGQQMMTELGLDPNSRGLRDAAARYVAGKGAAHSYYANYTNLIFDIAQSALFFRGVGRSTRAGFMGHSKKVKDAQKAILKNPKLPKTKIGKLMERTRRGRNFLFWSGTEGIEEQINFISMQEGIRHGDVLAGNTGYETNPDFAHGSFAQRLNQYYNDGELWTASLMGTIGGGIFTGISNVKNRKAQRERNEAAIKEINNRVDFLRESLKKRQKAQERGDTNAIKEQDELMALEMALNAARSGTTDLLLDMINDPVYEELLQEYGITTENVEAQRAKMKDIILKTEKKFNKYVNKITGTKYSYGLANALTQMDMAVDIYDSLAKAVQEQIDNLSSDNAYNQEQFSLGPNTKRRFELRAQREALLQQIEQMKFARGQAATESTNPNATEQERQEAKDLVSMLDGFMKMAEEELSKTDKETASLKADSKETYEPEAYDAEEKFLNEANTNTESALQQKKRNYVLNRNAAWNKLQDMLNGKWEKDKVDEAFTNDSERDAIEKAIAEGRDDIATSAINEAIKDDFRDFVKDNPNLTEQDIIDFFKEHKDNEEIREYGEEVLERFRTRAQREEYRNAIEELRAQAAEASEEVKSEIDKKVEKLKKDLFDPKISRKESARRTKLEQEFRENKADSNRYLYGEQESQDYLVNELFDGVTKYVPVVWNDKTGMIYRDEQTNELIFREGETNKEFIVNEHLSDKVHRDSKGRFTQGPTLGYLGMLLLRDANLDIQIKADGRTYMVDGEYYNNLESDPSSAIEYDNDANVVSVTLTKWDGTKVTFTNPMIAYELADVIETLEAVKRTRFNDLVKSDFMIVEMQGQEYIVSYQQTDLFTETLVATDINGNPIQEGELNQAVLRRANAMLSAVIQQEINNLKQSYNETKTTQAAPTSRLTDETMQQDEMGQGEVSSQNEKLQVAEVNAAGKTSNSSPAESVTPETVEEQERIIENTERKVNENNPEEEPATSEEAQQQDINVLEIDEATSGKESGQTTAEQARPIETSSNPTTQTNAALRKTYPQAWTKQFMSGMGQYGQYQNIRDKDGNLVEEILSPDGGTAYNIITLDQLTGPQLEAMNNGDPRYQQLYIFEPLLGPENNVQREGDRLLESDKLVPYQINGKPAVRVQIKENAIAASEVFDTELLNSPELGVGTKVVLRIEENWPYFSPTEAGQGVVTIRLASDPNRIISVLSSSQKSQINDKLRRKIAKYRRDFPGKDIPATIAGKTNGYVINIKHKGQSIQQNVSALGTDIVFGIDLGGSGINYNNTNENNFESEFTEQGYLYARIKSASGRYIPVRLTTNKLSEKAIDIILNALVNDTMTAEEKQLLVEQLVYIPRGKNADAQFDLGSKTNKTFAAKFDVTMDNFVIKFPFRGQVIGIQYNMEGKEGNQRNNLASALEGGEFLFKLYDANGKIIPVNGVNVAADGSSGQRVVLRNSKELQIVGDEVKKALKEHLGTKVYNIQKHKINTKEEYLNPLGDTAFANYDTFLREMNIVSTDIPASGQQQFMHSRLYLDVPESVFTPAEKSAPEFLQEDNIELTPVPEPDGEFEVDSSTTPESLSDILGGQPQVEETSEDESTTGEVNEVDPSKDDDFDVKLRQYEEVGPGYDLMTDTEKQWVLSRFGEEALDIVNRVKYMTLKDGRQAWGYYHNGLMTVAQGAIAGTAYWEAFRRIYDLHLTTDEKSAIELEAIEKYGSVADIETKLAEEFKDYMITENAEGFGAAIKRFFRDLMYHIKNMLGMRSEIEYLFRDLNKREFTQYTAEEAASLSQARAPKLREKRGYNQDQVNEIVGNINMKLAGALKAKYAKMAEEAKGVTELERDQMRESWREALTKPSEIKGAYESIRQQWETAGKRLVQSENENQKLKGENVINVTKPDVWYDVVDEFGNVISPGFQSLAVRNLRAQFGVKYALKKGNQINYDNAVIEDPVTDEDVDIVEEGLNSKERIFGVNYYNTPVKQTLSKEIKFELGFIEERNKKGEIVYGKVLGLPKYMQFDEVYAYLSVNLANVPQGKVLAKLNELADKGHFMMQQVLDIYNNATPQWQNKFVSHFNKQNIRFKTLIIDGNGIVKVVHTNRNGLEQQIIQRWVDNRNETEIYNPTTGKEDALNPAAVSTLKELYDRTTQLARQKASKKEYLRAFKNTLDYAGIRLSDEAYLALFNDDTVQVSDLNTYMVGNSSFEFIMKTLMKFQNPYMKGSAETGALRRLASLDASFRIDNYAASFLSGAKKPIYAINLNTYDSKTTLELRSDETYQQAIADRFRDVFYSPSETQRHVILNLLNNYPEVRQNFNLSTFDVIREANNAGKATAYNQMNDALSAITRFSMFYNSGLDFAEMNTGTKGDKTQSKYITLPKIGPRSRYGLWSSNQLGEQGYIDTAVRLLMPAVLGEMARISKTQKQLFGPNPISLNEEIQYVHYLKTKGDRQGQGLRFVQFPEFNTPDFFTDDGKLRQQESVDQLAVQQALIKTKLEEYVKAEIQKTLDTLVDVGAVSVKETGVYENEKLPAQALEGKRTATEGIRPALIQFAINDIVYKPYISTIFGPDLAYYKPDANGNPVIEAGKRAYQSITPGIDAVWNEDKQYGLPSKFSHAIIEDIIVDNEEGILKILTDANVDSKIAKRIASAYKRINSTDAQGYTTLEFHKKQMESDGSWLPEHQIAYEKYWSKGLMGDAKARALLLDPRKTYYFGERVVIDSQGNESIVYEQIKHSTIPLVREFTEQFKEAPGENKFTLNQLRIRMERKDSPIDMVNFESAVKIGASGKTTAIDLVKGREIKVNYLETKHLRSPQVIETKTKAPLDGTQMAKLILANIKPDAVYNMFGDTMSGQEVVDLYNKAYAERIMRSHNELANKLGVSAYQDAVLNRDTMTEDQFNKAQLDFLLRVRDVVTNSLEQRDLPDNYYAALDIQRLVNDVNSYGFEAPLSFPPFAKRFESILLSLFKNQVLKQRMNGMSVVQVAEFGYNLDNRLAIKPHKNGGVYAEVALPYELATKIGLQPGDVVEDSDIYDLIGYRIPTQGKNSMLSLKVVKVLPENMGGIIMLPAEITTMMGSDFDIDKMYLLMPELGKQNQKISAFDINRYKQKNSFEGLSDAALTNLLFDLRQGIITSRNHLVEQLDPLDSPTYTTKVEEYERKGLIPSLSGININSFAADLYLEKINKDASLLIGIFSLHSTGHSIAQQVGLEINPEYAINISAGGKKSHTSLSNIEGFDGRFISSYLSEDQNEALDNAKHQRIGRAGVTVYNSGVVALLNRAGFNNSITLDFINQPIIREFLIKRYKEDGNVTDIQIAKEIANSLNLGMEFDAHRKGEITFTPTENYLSESLTANLMDPGVARKQIQLLSDFLNYAKVGRDLALFNTVVSPETLKNLSRLSFIENYEGKVEYLNGLGSSLTMERSTERIQAYQKYGLTSAVDFVSQFVPYNLPGFKELKRQIAYATGQQNGILSPELVDVINSMGLFFALTRKQSPFASMIYENRPVVKDLLFTKENSLVSHMEKIKNKYNLQDDVFLGMLHGHESNVDANNFFQLIAFNNTTKLGVDQLNAITNRWAELLVDPRQEVRTLAQNLAKYSVLTSGFMMGPNSFVDLVPMSYWKSSGLTEYFRKEERTMSYEFYFDNAAEQIIRNMFAEQGLLMTVDSKQVNGSDNVRKNYNLNNNEYFVHDESNPQLIIEKEDGSDGHVTYFKSFMEGKFRLFKHRFDTQTGAVYEEIQPLGERFRLVEMQADNAVVESINPKNTVVNPETESRTDLTLDQQLEDEQTNLTDLLQLDPQIKQATLNTLDQRIEQWLMEHFGIPVEKYNNLRDKLGVDAIGMADMLNKVVKIDNERDRYTLPEEAAHFFVEMMEAPAMERLLNLVAKTKTYQEVTQDYANIYFNERDFAKEAAGKILAKFIVGEYQGEAVKEDYGTGLLGTLARVWDAIKRFISRAVGRDEINSLNSELTKILGPAASAIINGVNPGGLSIDNIGVNKYYALNNINLEFRDSKGNKMSPAELLRRGANFAQSKVPYLRQMSEKDKMAKLIEESSNIQDPTEASPYYEQDGVKMNRVSRVMEVFQDPFKQQEIAEKVAATNRKNGSDFNTADKVIELWDFLRDDMGTGMHSIAEGIINKSDMSQILDGLPAQHRTAFEELIPSIRDWVRTKEAAGSTLYAEVRLADKSDLVAGTADIIEVTANGRKIIHDFKTKVRGKFNEVTRKLPDFKGPLSGIQNTLLNKYRIQLSMYKYIIEEKGIKVDGLNIVPIEADVAIDNEGNITFANAAITTESTPIINKLKDLEAIPKKTIRRVLDYISPNEESLLQQDEYDRVLKVFKKAKGVLERKIKLYSKEQGNNDYANRLKEIFNEMEELNEKEGLVLFVKRAISDLSNAQKRLNQLKKDDALNARLLNQIRDFVSAYNILDEITLLAPLLSETGYENLVEKYVMPAIAKRDLILEDYKGLARAIIADSFADLTSNPVYKNNPEKFLEELEVAGGDITWIARWLDAVGDSTDPTLAMIDKMVSIQRGKVNKAEYDLVTGKGALHDLVKKLEDFQHGRGVSIWKYRDLYDFMLEKDEKGNLTGRIVTQYDPEFRDAKNKFMNDMTDQGYGLNEIQWKQFFEEDASVKGRYNKWLAKSPDEYKSKKLAELTEMKDDDPRKIFYKFFIENYKIAQSHVPQAYRRNAQLPSLRATQAERAFMNEEHRGLFKGTANAIRERMGELFAKHEDNIMWGEYVDAAGDPMSYVPVHYSNRIGNEEGQLSPSDVSYDLASGLKMYYTMATNFNEMQQILPEIEAAKELVKTRRVRKLKRGMPIKDAITGEDVTTAGIDSRAYGRLKDYFDMVVYGKRKKQEGAISLFGKEVTVEQVADSLAQFGSLRVLALNHFAGVSNLTFGTLMNATEAHAQQFFTKKDWARAKGIYLGYTGADTMGGAGIIADTLSRTPKSKLGQINELFNVLQHFDEYGRRFSPRQMGLRLNQGALYFMMSSGEHMIQSQLAMAMMINKKFETSKGKTNLWDAYSVVDGKLVLDPEVAEQFSEQDRILFAEKIQAVFQRIHGIYNEKDKAAIQQYAAGRWAMQFRKWLRPGFRRRYEGMEKLFYSKDSDRKGPNWNERTESYSEGVYVTAVKFIGQMGRDFKRLQFLTLTQRYKELEPWQQANVRRGIGEVASFYLLTVLGSVFFGAEDDPEDRSPGDWYALYSIKRVQSEIAFYNPFGSSFYEILRTPAANLTTLEAYSKLLSQAWSDSWSIILGGDVERYKRKTGKYEKGDAKINKYIRNVLPFKELDTDPKDKIKFFDLK